MTVTPQKRATWAKTLGRLTKGAQEAQDALHVAIHKAAEDGVSQADIAHMIGDRSPSGIRAKIDKGKAILDRKRS